MLSSRLPSLCLRRSSGNLRARLQPDRCCVASSTSSTMQTPVLTEKSILDLVAKIHATPAKAAIYVTGGAAQALTWLLSVPGASHTILEACVPYSRDSLVDVLGQEPNQYCSQSTAVEMAQAAYRRAAALTNFGDHVLGVAATCSLATVPLKRGEHRAYLAVHDGAAGTSVVSITLDKGARSRAEEDQVVSSLLIQLLAKASGVPHDAQVPHPQEHPCHSDGPAGPAAAAVTAHDIVQEQFVPAEDPLQQLLQGKVRCVEFCGRQVTVDAPRRHKVFLPGSFNPLHEGHKKLLQAAAHMAGKEQGEAAFELSVGNPDKGMLPLEEVKRRVAQFVEQGLPVVVTSAPLFTIKAQLLQGARFVVGYDTAVRLVMPKYHNDSMTAMLLEFERLRMAGCSFIVAGRKDSATGLFKKLSDVQIPPELSDLFMGLPEETFRVDLSSTELRAKALLQQQQQKAGRGTAVIG